MYMKSVLTVLAIVSTFIFSYGQSYEKMIKGNTLYNYFDTYMGPPPKYSTLYRFSNDTIIGSDHYMELEISLDSINWYRSTCFFREDTLNQRVYLFYIDKNYLIYDFSLELHEPISIYNPVMGTDTVEMTVTGTDSIYLSGRYYKTMELDGYIYWIEGIGDIGGILNPGKQTTGFKETLVCYYINGSLFYNNPQYPDCFTIFEGIEENNTEIQLLYENNFYQILSPRTIINYSIYNSIGQLIFEKTTRAEELLVNLESYKPGIYYVNLLFDGNSGITLKLVKI